MQKSLLKTQKTSLESKAVIYYKTPIGTAKIIGDQKGIQSISVLDDTFETSKEIPSFLKQCISQLDEYFAGTRTEFDLQLNPQGTEFQLKVWSYLKKIPKGKTKSYLEVAKAIGKPSAFRAVANAVGKNPFPPKIPCHRVIRSDGSMGGYSGKGGIKKKKILLQSEGITI